MNTSTDDATSLALHTPLTNRDRAHMSGCYLWTIACLKLITKLHLPQLCEIQDFLTERPQAMRLDRHTTRVCAQHSPTPYSLFTHNCGPAFDADTVVKFADDMTVVGLITNSDKSAHKAERQNLVDWWRRSIAPIVFLQNIIMSQ